MSAPTNAAMLLGEDGPPDPADIERWSDDGVRTFLAPTAEVLVQRRQGLGQVGAATSEIAYPMSSSTVRVIPSTR